MYTLKEKALILSNRSKELLTAIKNDDLQSLSRFGLFTGEDSDLVPQAMKKVEEIVEDMSKHVADRLEQIKIAIEESDNDTPN